MAVVYSFLDTALKLISGLLILYSLFKFNGLVMRMRQSNSAHFANERLMTVHFVIFSLFVLANFGSCIINTIYSENK